MNLKNINLFIILLTTIACGGNHNSNRNGGANIPTGTGNAKGNIPTTTTTSPTTTSPTTVAPSPQKPIVDSDEKQKVAETCKSFFGNSSKTEECTAKGLTSEGVAICLALFGYTDAATQCLSNATSTLQVANCVKVNGLTDAAQACIANSK